MSSISTTETTIFCLHYLGGSAREWSSVAAELDGSLRLVPVDLPGFGDAAMRAGFSVESMALFVAEVVRQYRPDRWMLAGHSMGAKVATVLARWQSNGALDVDGLVGLVLLAGSPPSPEPMSEEKRASMSSWFLGDEASSMGEAQRYVADNVGELFDSISRTLAVADALACNRAAWIAWLQEGSKEDWAARVGVLTIPTLIVTGSADQGLGREAQRKFMAPHFIDQRMVDVPGAGHLLPLERPKVIAQLFAEHAAQRLKPPAQTGNANQRYQELIVSDRVGEGTRRALLARIDWQAPTGQKVLSKPQLEVLDHALDRIIPQRKPKINLAERLDQQLANGKGDGWRFAVLPQDSVAYQRGLDTLQAAATKKFAMNFADLSSSQQDELLASAMSGMLTVASRSGDAGYLDAEQMKKWLDDVRADATRLYMAHPDTLARIGYSGIANGGDGHPKSGFIRIGLGEIEAWEPKSAGLLP